MKRLKMTLMAFAAISSIGTSFAFNHNFKRNATIYYAIKSGTSFIWSTSVPRSVRCIATVLNSTCTIVTNTVPTDGIVPPGHAITNTVYE